jgi:glycerol-3-phosphate O-acyltransferase
MENKSYPHLIKNIKNWPIYKAARQKKAFKDYLKEQTFQIIKDKKGGQLHELVAQCAYSEKKRVTRMPFKVDPPSEKGFWKSISQQVTQGSDCDTQENCEALLQRIVSRYAEEIVGDFKVETFSFAEKFLAYFFNRLYSSWMLGSMLNIFTKRKTLQKKLKLTGYVDHARTLFEQGTVVLLPTHQSNLDSILIGYFMELKAGMPAFSYGAGLNLYNFEIMGYFMDRLGAYKVDRRKRNAIYHETLFTFLRLSVQDGVNNLFFPAGGRVRDGRIEADLKTGLMSALIQAQKSNSIRGVSEKIFVIPVVMNNHFVLEAKALINDYLVKRGKEKFSRNKKPKSYNYMAALPYICKLIGGSSEAVLSFGKPMDALGNLVDERGRSLDKNGNLIHVADYFKTDGVFKPDYQRESVYTKKLATEVAASYKKHMVVLSSQLVAYVSYMALKKQHNAADIFELMGVEKKQLVLEVADILPMITALRDHIIDTNEDRNKFIHDDLYLEPKQLMTRGVRKLGIFHVTRPLKLNSDGKIICKDLKLLYYYANRLRGLGFKAVIFG